jgi:hypothetical protein
MGNDDEERTGLLRDHHNNSAIMPPLPSYQETVGETYQGSAPPYSDVNNHHHPRIY